MCRNLPPRHRGSRCHLHAPTGGTNAGWRRRLARPPSPQAYPRALSSQATAAADGRRVAGRRPCGCRTASGCLCGRLPLQGALVAVGRHYKGPGRGPFPLSSLHSL
ncbi:hypothetical protein BHM03_00003660 [Ensete ventricosum]|nr:hypothetical protein BHM03_00003660 [Ensete ventricosum]